jgi:hypothetical protein
MHWQGACGISASASVTRTERLRFKAQEQVNDRHLVDCCTAPCLNRHIRDNSDGGRGPPVGPPAARGLASDEPGPGVQANFKSVAQDGGDSELLAE